MNAKLFIKKTSVMAVKAIPRALDLIEKAEKEKGDDLTRWETVKVAGPTYIPAILLGTSTIACIFGAQILNQRQQAALMSAYALLDQSYKEYKNKVKEIYGKEAYNEIINSIMVEKAKEVGVRGSYLASNCDLSL